MGRCSREGTRVLLGARTKKSAWAALAKETLKNESGAGKGKIDKPLSGSSRSTP
jgi:hypothetical protein